MAFLTLAFPFSCLAELPVSEAGKTILDRLMDAPFTALAACGVLGLFFVICFMTLGGKLMKLRDYMMADEVLQEAFHGSAHPLAMLQNEDNHELAPLDLVYQAGSKQIAYHMTGTTDFSSGDFIMRLRAAGKISPTQLATAESAMEGALIESRAQVGLKLGGLEAVLSTIPWLACLAPVAVWMEHSMRFPMKEMTYATKVAAVAPVALTLIGTVFCRLWLQVLKLKAKALCERHRSFATELAGIFDRSYVNHSDPMDRLPSIGSFGASDVPSFSLPPTDVPVRTPHRS